MINGYALFGFAATRFCWFLTNKVKAPVFG
jgi:hypothetical protein